jgi:uncharacterized protein YndB with AHSA1/START domain
MLKKILVVLAVLVAGVLAVAATRPDSFEVRRSAVIQAPADKLFPMIDDLHAWAAWSPYEKLDPQMKKTFEGPPAGKDAAYGWQGNSKAGAGRIRIVESVPSSRIGLELTMLEPWEARNDVSFTFQPKGAGTEVTWAMRGKANLMVRVMGLFVDMDQMVGKDFAEGLANLKALAEK